MARQTERTLTVRVVRSGGFAGISREWTTQCGPDEEDDLRRLVEACPWHRTPAPDTLSRDRFVWRIEVRGALRRTATVPDAALDGPWRALVQRVQELAER